jgi:hypothetical protein
MVEIFKDIPNYEGLYQVSNYGRIKALPKKAGSSNRKERILKPIIKVGADNNYLRIMLYKNNKHRFCSIHRLVMLTFKGKSNLQVNHIDGNKQNNRLDNLEYCTAKENTQHAWENGLCEKYNNNRKIEVKQFDKQKNLINSFNSIKEATFYTKINHISSCINNKRKTAGGYIWRKV